MGSERDDELGRRVDLLWSQREIERKIFQVGYALEAGDFERVGELMGDATFGADLIGRRAFRGSAEITAQYTRTNVVYEGMGRASKEIYHNVLVDFGEGGTTARSWASYTVAQQPPGHEFTLLVAGVYEDEWARDDVGADWRWVDRFLRVQFKGDLDRHMHSGSQPYN